MRHLPNGVAGHSEGSFEGRGGARWVFGFSQSGDGLSQSGAWLKPRRRGLSQAAPRLKPELSRGAAPVQPLKYYRRKMRTQQNLTEISV